MIDLHCHTYFSDGELSPEDLIAKAEKQGITCLSLTDHDTLAGYPRLEKAAANTSIRLIRGIELSTRWKKYDIHILGYGLEHCTELEEVIQKQNQSRNERARQIGAALGLIGLKDAYDKACALAGHVRVGRPHFAQILVNEGFVKDMQGAFKQFLVRGKVGYIPTPWISIAEAVAAIKAAKGQAVIAHPLKYGLTRSKLHELINEFKDAGGEGMEVVSGETNVTQIKEMAATCLRFKLLASSGSDFHRDGSSRVNLGSQQLLPANCTPIWQEWNIEQGTL